MFPAFIFQGQVFASLYLVFGFVYSEQKLTPFLNSFMFRVLQLSNSNLPDVYDLCEPKVMG